jgi:DNA-binding GntR family transcriptional regulator
MSRASPRQVPSTIVFALMASPSKRASPQQGARPLAPTLNPLLASDFEQPAGKGGKLTQRAYLHVRAAVLSGELASGTVLSSKDVAAELGISPTPVRQAFQLLLQEGLLDVGRRRQMVVRGFRPEQLDEITLVREALERIALTRACELMQDEEIDYLRLLLIRQKRVSDVADDAEYDRLDEQFHLAIAAGAQLAIVHKFLSELGGFVRMNPIRRGAKPRSPAWLHAVTEQHERIVDAIAARDVATALQVLHENLHVLPDLDAPASTRQRPSARKAASRRKPR